MPIDFNDLSTVTLFMLCRYDCILCNFNIINPSSEEKKSSSENKITSRTLSLEVQMAANNFAIFARRLSSAQESKQLYSFESLK